MKTLWRKISFILAWLILVLGLVTAIVTAVKNGEYGFVGFCNVFLPILFFFTIIMAYLEHTNNVEMRVDQTYRKNNDLPVLPDNAYTNLPISSSPAPQYQQPAPAPMPAPAPQPQYAQPAPQPQYQQPAPAPMPAPVQQPEAMGVCPACGKPMKIGAKFCPTCGHSNG